MWLSKVDQFFCVQIEHNKVISGFLALYHARRLVAGLQPAIEGTCKTREGTEGGGGRNLLCHRRPFPEVWLCIKCVEADNIPLYFMGMTVVGLYLRSNDLFLIILCCEENVFSRQRCNRFVRVKTVKMFRPGQSVIYRSITVLYFGSYVLDVCLAWVGRINFTPGSSGLKPRENMYRLNKSTLCAVSWIRSVCH
ncbi:hypothetical protein PoB_004207400 [Plakobranchus ocellatus]|uniref:Uncharacterized protein n=1 Tax=Plakobranchus ocellatus TaxID=259542 RepID=A0AAV4BB19_9GAST|nr:hypothetical protein PoB_004207400 [Plakobranchus ocellatus]